MKSPLKRYENNPIITPDDMPIECYSVFNAGAIRHNGKIILMLRVDNTERRSQYHMATSEDGINFEIESQPITFPTYDVEKRVGKASYSAFDMRITEMDGQFYIFHALPVKGYGCCIGLMSTKDFKHFEPISTSVPMNRNAVLFPEKINGEYVRLERPMGGPADGRMWVSYSKDLVYWGKSAPVPMPMTPWQVTKNGAGCIPIKTSEGWLEIYHGVGPQTSGKNYFLGACLLDLEDPSKVIAAPESYILAPQKLYECVGQVPNVVFTGGCVEMDDGTLNVYYAGADTVIGLAQTTVQDLVEFCLTTKK